MSNNDESIKKYNDLLIKYLNDLVNSIEDNNLNSKLFEDISNRLRQQLVTYNLDIADQGVRTLMANAFKEYSNILKKYFDSCNIHRIDISHSKDNSLTSEMNEVTSNLSNAVINMNKIPEYVELINRIKSNLKGYFNQNFSNYQSIEFEIEQILNDVIVGAFATYTTKKIEDFTRDILPELYTIADSISYDNHIQEVTVEENTNVNAERDAFINETMDIEIEEGFANGVVTLRVVDSNGNTSMYYGTEAMEKLTSYNQLFESSRPGKKADTSNWVLDTSSKKDAFSNNSQPIANGNVNIVNNLDNINNSNETISSDNINLVDSNDNKQNNIDNNEKLIKNYLSNYDNNSSQVNEVNNISDSEFGNLTALDNDTNTEKDTSNNPDTESVDLSTPSSIMNYFNNMNEPTTNSNDLDFGNLTSSSGNINNNEFNNLEVANNISNNNVGTSDDNIKNDNSDDDLKKVKEMMGFEESNNSFGFSFLPEYNNPNADRDEFIRKATGIDIEEDKDNKGNLYLKVVEPTGREQIYTGKEAVRMIKNFNKTYLDANPNATVDTTLIDNFKEE